MKAYSKMARAGSAAVVFAVACAGSLLACSSEGFQPSGGGGTGGAAQDGGGASGGAAGSSSGGAAGSGGLAGAKGTADDGDACGAGSDCKSGFCADGVCCDTACDNDCESCAVPGAEGTCAAYDEGTDPDGECLGSAQAGDTCAGTCNGASACEFPDTSTTCGTGVCTGGESTGYACDGTGACKLATVDCAPYLCGTDSCTTACAKDTDCASGNFCLAGQCITKQANGQTCSGANQCSSGNCVDGTCCNVATCGSPLSCSDGTCKCGDSVCGAGETCVLWYKDGDGDGYGDASNTKYGCSGKAPSGYVSNKTDCYDANKDAHPGQTAFFPDDRGDSSFDYDCDNAQTKQYANVGGLKCIDCHPPGKLFCSFDCGVQLTTGTVFSMAYQCEGSGQGPYCGGPKTRQGFHLDVACGKSGALYSCSMNTCDTSEQSLGSTTQGCR